MLSLDDLKALIGNGGLVFTLTENAYYRLRIHLNFDRAATVVRYSIDPKIDGLPTFISREFSSTIYTYQRDTKAIETWVNSGGTIQELISAGTL